MDRGKIKKAIELFLEGLGEDAGRPGLAGTPERVARMCEEIFSGISQDPLQKLEVMPAEGHKEMVLLRDMPFYSVCEHHLLPFFGKTHVAYIPQGGRVTGLSRIAHAVQIMCGRLQLQERLTTQIADTMMEALRPRGVLVVIEAEHLCLSMRGLRKPGTLAVTSAVRGLFKTNESTRAEAMALIKGQGGLAR